MALTTPITSVLEALKPFEPDDGLKGTFLLMRIAGMERKTALRLINRGYKSWLHWRSADKDFCRLDNAIPVLVTKFGGEARVLRTASLDNLIIESGILVFKKILNDQPVTSDAWAYATRLAGLRIPMMGAKEGLEGGSWERLANSITKTQRELTVRMVDLDGTEKSVTARETVAQPSQEQRQMASEIVGQMLDRAKAKVVEN